MIDTKELRRLAQAATPHVGHACKYQDAHWLREGHVDFENADLFIASECPQEDTTFYAAANPAAISELLDRLEESESDRLEQARLNGMDGSREAALMARLEDVIRDARRYLWLRNAALDWYVGPEHATYNDVVCSGEYCNYAGGGVALDSAIDALLAAAQEPKP